ncbi:MAG: Cysteine desulfurase IscS [bacterium]|nr:Cysteine desulfurase IscS [bacterium]
MEAPTFIYLDHAATTPLHPVVAGAMRDVLESHWGNPSSLHRVGQQARQRIDAARDEVAGLWHCHPREVIFTGSATEGDNMALRGLAWANQHRGRHLVISSIEHEAILNTARQLEKQGFEVTAVDPDSQGVVQPAAVAAALRPDTIAASIMWVNNEIGSIAPLEAIGHLLRERRVYFHSDMTQAIAHLPVDFSQLPVDVATCSAHKFYGPKGTGINFIRFGTPLWPLLTGGSHEFDLRASTENLPGIVGIVTALRHASESRAAHEAHCVACAEAILARLGGHPAIARNGDPATCVPGILNLRFQGIEAETLLLKLDLAGVAVSTGSACSSGSVEPSHVMTAMQLPLTEGLSSLRLSFGWGNTVAGAALAADILKVALSQLAPEHYGAWAGPLPTLTPEATGFAFL